MSRARVAAIPLALALLAAAPPPARAGEPPPFLPGIRPLGMGNAFVAVADDRNTLYYNPAGLANLTRISLAGLGGHLALDQEFLDVITFIRDHEEQFSNFDTVDQNFYDELAPFDDRWVAVDGHVYSDLTAPHFGLGAYTTAQIQFKIDRGVYEPRVHAQAGDDIVGVVGAGMGLGRFDLKVGVALKALWRRELNRTLTAREVADFDPSEVADDLASAESGFGMDLGAYWRRPGSRLSLGAVARDAVGFVGGEGTDGSFDLGAAWNLRQNRGRILRRAILAADVRNVFTSRIAFASRMHFGAEAQLPVVAVRAGFNQGYPTAGVSLDLFLLEVDYCFYGRERGRLPGEEEQFVHAVEAHFGF